MQLSLFQSRQQPPKPADQGKANLVRSVLGPRLPEAALDHVVSLILDNPVSMKVVKQRTSKSGDFRPPQNGKPPQITVNGNLNPYAFLITLIHELAHHHVHLEYLRKLQKFTLRRKTRPLPHGDEWKDTFRNLMGPFLNTENFPPDILKVLLEYLEDPKASSSVDHHLARALKAHDPPDATTRLEELPYDAVFTLHGKRIFTKKEKVRTRFRCICMKTNRVYLVSPGAPVELVRLCQK